MNGERRPYRWRGVSKSGTSHMGVMTLTPDEMAGAVKIRFDCGWRYMLVAEGEGPVPPSPYGEAVAMIDKHPETGRRCWWAEGSSHAKPGQVTAGG